MAADAKTEAAKVKKPLTSAEKLEKKLAEKAALEKEIAALKAKQTAQERKDDNHEKIIIGAAIIADMRVHPEIRAAILESLNRAITQDRHREFLKRRGWWK